MGDQNPQGDPGVEESATLTEITENGYLQDRNKLRSHPQIIQKNEIEIFIDLCLKSKNKLSLIEVETELEHRFGCTLSKNDKIHIEKVYVEMLVELWLNEASENVLNQDDNILEHIDGLKTIITLQDCFSFSLRISVFELPYNNLLKELNENSEYLKYRNKITALKFKATLFAFLMLKSINLQNELNFQKTLVHTIKKSKLVSELLNSLHVADFLETKETDETRFRILLNQIMVSQNFESSHPLKIAARAIVGHKKYFLVKTIHDMITLYLKPLVINEKLEDGRKLLEVKGEHIVIGQILKDVEGTLEFDGIEEVRFINSGVIHVDADLNSEIWHGKNVVVCTETMIVSKGKIITWDVSGQDCTDEETGQAGTHNDGQGLDGTAGKSGESGGNVVVICDEIENASCMKIVSNGGKGGKGQAGGNGDDGIDGAFLTEQDFKNIFPPPSKWISSRKKQSLETIKASTMNDIHSVKYSVMGKLKPISIDLFQDIFMKLIEGLDNIYFETKTNSGCQVTFSFYNPSLLNFCQSFLLHRGANGEPGKREGRGGYGGKGGFAGDISVMKNGCPKNDDIGIEICANNGEDGQHGKSGRAGKPGKSGIDCAYIDSTKPNIPLFNKVKFPKYYITLPMDSQRLIVEYHQAKGPERIHCFHNGLYAEIKNTTEKFYNVVHVKRSQTTISGKELKDSNFHSKVHRKKNIPLDSIKKELFENKSSYVNLHGIEEDMNRIYEEIANEEMLLEKKIMEETRITRKVEFSPGETYSVTLPNEDFPAEQLLDVLPNEVYNNKNMSDISLMNKLKEENDLQELRSLWSSSVIQTIYLLKDNSSEDANFLSNKYQLAVLDYLEKAILEQDYFKLESHSTFIPKDVGSVNSALIISNDKETYSEVESYLCDDSNDKRLNIVSILEGSADNEFCMGIFNLYLNEYSSFDDSEKFLSGTHLQAYKKHYEWFKLKKSKDMNIKLLPILHNLTRDRDLCNKLVKAITELNVCLKMDVEHRISSDPSLSVFYEKYREVVNKPFVWKSGLMSKEMINSKLMEGYKSAIFQKGPMSVFFREVVACIFKTNILVYRINESKDDMVLVHNHNPKGDEVVQILIKDNKCFKLKTDEDFSKIITANNVKGQLCNKVQLHVGSIKGQESYKEEFDKFISERPFLLGDYSGISKSDELRIKVNHMLVEDENINLIASSFEENEEQRLIRSRLEMLKHKYIGYQSFLCFIALHFKTEGNKLAVDELCCVVNFLLKSVIESSSKSNVVSWIIAANHQKYWIVEFLLLKLEMYLKKPLDSDTKTCWRNYLNKTYRHTRVLFFDKLSCDERLLSRKDVEEVLLLISLVPNHLVGLANLSLDEWKYYLNNVFWTNQIKNTGKWSREELKLASYHLEIMENHFGKDLCCKVVKLVESKATDLESKVNRSIILDTLKRLVNQEITVNYKLLKQFLEAGVHEWDQVLNKQCFTTNKERDLYDLQDLVNICSNTSSFIKENIDKTIQSVKKIYCFIEFLKGRFEKKSDLKNWISALLDIFEKRIVPESKEEKIQSDKINGKMTLHLKEMQEKIMKDDVKYVAQEPNDFFQCNIREIFLSTISMGIYIFEKKMLRHTQLLAIMIFLNTGKSVLGQISTGEGKTFVIVAVAIMKALCGNKVDVVTSSHVLAKRDAKNHKHICDMFGIKVDHNCSDNIDERKIVYSKCQIVYGELSYFQRDFLLDRAYNNNILGDRIYQTIIVDEVDSMLLDKANNVLYLSHDIPGLDTLVPLFVFIWRCVKEPYYSTSDSEEYLDVDRIKDRIIDEVYGQIKVEHIRNFDVAKEKSALQTWIHLKRVGIIDSEGKVLREKFDENEIDKALENCFHRDDVKYFLKKVLLREKQFKIPNYLKGFVASHLEKWIESAANAMNLENNIDYVIDIDRSAQSSDRSANIIIVDSDTGTDMVNSQWDLGLHQFLQLKHGCRISTLSFKAVFISNVSYLKLYKTLLGLTGTLGAMNDRDLLKQVYEVEFVTIPTAKPKRFFEEQPILCNNPDEWSTKIVEKIYEVTKSRSALIICQSLSDVYTLEKRFKVFAQRKNLPKRCIQTYTRDYEEFNVKDLGIMKIIISTNLAGRGTDIHLSQQLIDNGGLHVCLSFLPRNSRIEEQAFGRSARNGQPGTGQMIFMSSGQNSISRIINLKKESNMNEIFRLSNVKKHYEGKIKYEEELFHRFLHEYKDFEKSEICEDIKAVLQMACLDSWAFFLETSKPEITITHSFDLLLKRILEVKIGNIDTWIREIQDPFQLTRLGLIYLKKNDAEKAVKIFDHVIKTEPNFKEAACYYKACARTRMDDLESKSISDLICELELVKDMLKKRIHSSLIPAQFIDYLKAYDSNNTIKIDSFKEQQQIMCQIYETFGHSIKEITGYDVIPEHFTNFGPSSIIFNDLLQKNIVHYSINDNITESDLNFSHCYGICPKSLLNLLHNVKDGTEPLNEELIRKKLRKSALLPSRELFWKDLVSVGILQDEEKFVFVNHKELENISPSFYKEIKELCLKESLFTRKRVFLYPPVEFDVLGESCDDPTPIKDENTYALFNKEILKRHLGKTKYAFLKREKIMIFNKQASFSNKLMEPVGVRHFDSITLNDFLEIGLTDITASRIIKILVRENVIKEKNNCDPLKYELLANFEGLDKLELMSCRSFLADIRALLSHCFSFRIAIQQLQKDVPLCKGDYANFILPVPGTFLEHKLLFALKEREIIKCNVNIEQVKSGKLEMMYPRIMNKEGFSDLFLNVYNMEESKAIVEELIKKKWLKKTAYFEHFEMSYAYLKNRLSGETYCINLEETQLSDSFKCETKMIEQILKSYLRVSEGTESIKYFELIKDLAGNIHWVKVPNLKLKSLAVVLNERNIPTSEINIFNMNGFDHVLNLEEKKYTRAMIVAVSVITLAAVVQISLGVYMLMSPIGAELVKSGVNDVISSFESIISGQFQGRDYMVQKTLDLVTFGMYCLKVLNLKAKSLTVFSKTSKKIDHFQVFKRVASHVAEGVAYSSVFALTDKINESKEAISKELIDFIYHDIDQTIAVHPCFQNVCQLRGEDATKMIKASFEKIAANYKVKFQQTFNSIKLNHIFTLIQRTVSKGFNVRSYGIDDLVNVYSMFKGISEFIKSALPQIKEIPNLVNSMLNDLEKELTHLGSNTVGVIQNDLSAEDVLKQTKLEIKSILSSYIKENIVSPVADCFSNCVNVYMCQMISKRRKAFLRDDEIFENKINRKCKVKKQNKNKNGFEKFSIFPTEFDEITRGVLKTRNNKIALKYLVSQNTPMDVYGLEVCCKAITLVAKEENIRIPSLRVEVENDGVMRVFGIGNVNEKTLTLRIDRDSDAISNVKTNNILIKNVFNYISDFYLENHPEYKGLTADFLKELTIKAFDYFCSSAPCDDTSDIDQTIESGWVERDFVRSNVCKLNTEYEKNSPYQHSFCEGGWIFSSRVDVDLRDKEKRTSLNNINKHVNKGFEAALQKINRHIHRIQSRLRYFNLVLSDFEATKYKISPPSHDMEELLTCITVQYEIVMPILLKDVNRQVDFNILLCLQDKKLKIKRQPFGPHILYEINPVNEVRFLDKGLRGHVLLNMNCIDTSYSVKDCHTAGELMISLASQRPVGHGEIFTSDEGNPINNFECETSAKKRRENKEKKKRRKERKRMKIKTIKDEKTISNEGNSKTNYEAGSVKKREVDTMLGENSVSRLGNAISNNEIESLNIRGIETMPGGRSTPKLGYPVPDYGPGRGMSREVETMPGGRSTPKLGYPVPDYGPGRGMSREVETMPGGRSTSKLGYPVPDYGPGSGMSREVETMPGGRSTPKLGYPVPDYGPGRGMSREVETMPGGRSTPKLGYPVPDYGPGRGMSREVETMPGGRYISKLGYPVPDYGPGRGMSRGAKTMPGGRSTSKLGYPVPDYGPGSGMSREVETMPGGRSTSKLGYPVPDYGPGSGLTWEVETMPGRRSTSKLGYPVPDYGLGSGMSREVETMPGGRSTSKLGYPVPDYEPGSGMSREFETMPGGRYTSKLGYPVPDYGPGRGMSREVETMPGGRCTSKLGYPVPDYGPGSGMSREVETMPGGRYTSKLGYPVPDYGPGSGMSREAETMPGGRYISKLGYPVQNYELGSGELNKVGGPVPSCLTGISYDNCDFLVVGDSLFKYISDYIKLNKCIYGIFPHLKIDTFSQKINSLLVNCHGIKCLVMFFGNDIVKTSVSEQEIAHCIVNVVKSVQVTSINMRVIVCSLILPRHIDAQIWGRKIFNMNRILLEHCEQESWVNIDTNRIICPQDFGKDGIHFNRNGYYKLGSCITEECKKTNHGSILKKK